LTSSAKIAPGGNCDTRAPGVAFENSNLSQHTHLENADLNTSLQSLNKRSVFLCHDTKRYRSGSNMVEKGEQAIFCLSEVQKRRIGYPNPQALGCESVWRLVAGAPLSL
jgi:hypothetical protein